MCQSKYLFLGFCSTIISLHRLTSLEIEARLENDPFFWRSAHLLNLIYLLRNLKTTDNLYQAGFESLIELRAQRVDQALFSHENVETLFTGDSLIHLLEYYVNKSNSEEFRNAVYTGIADDRSDMFLYRLLDNVGRLQPRTVVISISGNDVLQGCDPDNIQSNRKLIVTRLRNSGVQRIIWLSLPPISEPTAFPTTGNIINENLKIRDLPVEYLDIYTPLSMPLGIMKPEYFVDGVHFNERAFREVVIPLLHSKGISGMEH
jgi:hypothetical protein